MHVYDTTQHNTCNIHKESPLVTIVFKTTLYNYPLVRNSFDKNSS